MLNNTQLNEIIEASIKTQEKIRARKDFETERFNLIQFSFFKSLYKTAMYYKNKCAVVDGIAMLDYDDMLKWYDESLPEMKQRGLV